MPKQNQSPSTKAFSLSLENQELHKKLELLGGTDAAELLDLNLENQQVIADQELELRNLREALLKYRKNQAAQEAGLESINKFKDEAEHKITSTIATQRSKLEELEGENASLSSSNVSKDTLIKSLQSQLTTLKSSHSELEVKLTSITSSSISEAAEKDKEIKNLTLKLSLQSSACKELMDSNVNLVEEKAKIKQIECVRIEDLSTTLRLVEEERDKLKYDFTDFRRSKDEEIKDLEVKVKDLEVQNDIKGRENNVLKSTVSKLKHEIKEAKKGGKELRGKIEDKEEYIKRQIENARRVRNVLRDTNRDTLNTR
ncbi:hypothetical protein TrCOL_g9878 [Triparma columacea]|uniref:Uncharacterized protein n=1 Tax=Triparma columacea TaxID=722753 RepID=A0A9W7GNF8_9STRA|nr:hypothetical protein TrCOL_g9878 [Triparma columacea]